MNAAASAANPLTTDITINLLGWMTRPTKETLNYAKKPAPTKPPTTPNADNFT
jgi:hypothetical protein